MFLTWYSEEAIAAATPAGVLSFNMLSLFIGTASYVGTFVAQYFGSKQYDKIGKIVWHGVYIGFFAAIVHLAMNVFSDDIFAAIGHDRSIQHYESVYFQILNYGAFFVVGSAAISGFFSGLGKTKIVMYVNLGMTVCNVAINYVLIFGKWGFPQLGIKGAAIATVASGILGFIAFLILFLTPANRKNYKTSEFLVYDLQLFKRLVKFGLPSGVQFFIEMAGFTFFMLLVGRLGNASLAATNIAININMLAFMPMIGCGIAISIMVGQYIGEEKPDLAEYSTYSGFHICMLYMILIALTYVLVPEFFIYFFKTFATYDSISAITAVVKKLLIFIAVYSVFDTFNIIFANAIKGAGDTRFVMLMLFILSVTILAVPLYVTIEVLQSTIYSAWFIFTVYIIALGLAFYKRFYNGKWKTMKVIETPVVV